jgi:phage baseplate assembly protein V
MSTRQLLTRILGAIGRGRVTGVYDDTGPIQRMQIQFSAIEVHDPLRRLAEFGFTSLPPAGADVLVAFLSGDRTNGVIVATGDQTTRFKNLQAGEAAIYNAFGASVYLTKNGIVVDGANQPVTVNNAAGITINSSDDVVLNMGGNDVVINNPGSVELAGTGGKKVALDGDPVVGGVIKASSTKVTAL